MGLVAVLQAVSVIITSYNQLKTLKILLRSLRHQTSRPLEVIVADDGSSDGILEAIDLLKAELGRYFILRLVTQADQGYRKSKILNEAIRQSKGDYLIFLDADVVLHQKFIADHLSLRRPNAFVCGRRVDLGQELTRKLLFRDQNPVEFGFFKRLKLELLLSIFNNDTVHWKRALRIPSPRIRRLMGYLKPLDLLGSNMSFWKSDLIEVNGFNEDLKSYWGEDGDLFIRMRNSGKLPLSAKGLCIQYHFFHSRRAPTPENQDFVHQRLGDPTYRRCQNGLELNMSNS